MYSMTVQVQTVHQRHHILFTRSNVKLLDVKCGLPMSQMASIC
ncbi:hypothetical protein ID866_11938 [Astraeus odoratus]|nr:hypothetical protein ID866_11938 [Astraeus odoratus]